MRYDAPGVHQHRPEGVHRKDRALLPPAEQKQRRIQQQKKQRQGVPLRRDLPEQHGGAGNAAVVQVHRGQKHGDADGVDDTGGQQ